MNRVDITDLMLTTEEAWALAQFVKRVGWDEIRINAQDEEECNLMRDAISQLQKALAENGYAPR